MASTLKLYTPTSSRITVSRKEVTSIVFYDNNNGYSSYIYTDSRIVLSCKKSTLYGCYYFPTELYNFPYSEKIKTHTEKIKTLAKKTSPQKTPPDISLKPFFIIYKKNIKMHRGFYVLMRYKSTKTNYLIFTIMKKLILFGCIIATALSFNANAQNKEMKGRHELKVSVSDATTLNLSDFFGDTLIDGTLFKTESEGTLMPSIGYRYFLSNRFAIGADLGYQHHKMNEVISNSTANKNGYKEKSHRFLILPMASYTYFQKNLFKLYGNAGVGTLISRNHFENATNKENETTANLAFQINPIGIRFGNESIGAFAEIGIGYKGFAEVGISIQL